jgi:hypothetical protein
VRRNRERLTVQGLNHNHNQDLKNLFKGAAISANTRLRVNRPSISRASVADGGRPGPGDARFEGEYQSMS